MRVLVLGDGNFSFSVSLLRALLTTPSPLTSSSLDDSNYHIIVSSFDSLETLTSKYPESVHHLSQLRSISRSSSSSHRLTVLHDIDATTLHLNEALNGLHFDAILFNFPHLGVEDCQLHASLLAHTCHSTSHLLSPSGSLYISLAEEQSVRWRLNEMAERNGLLLVESTPFSSSLLPGYEVKRHHNDRSFESRIGKSVNYRLALSSASIAAQNTASLNIFRLLLRSYEENAQAVEALPVLKINPNKRQRQTKVSSATEGMYRRIVPSPDESDYTATATALLLFECSICLKRLSSEQGVKTHVYTEHVLEKAKGETSIAPQICSTCGKNFRTLEALNNHVASVHTFVIPRGTVSHEREALQHVDQYFECNICTLKFPSPEELQAHFTAGVPPVDVRLDIVCSSCGRAFKDDRALGQHRALAHSISAVSDEAVSHLEV